MANDDSVGPLDPNFHLNIFLNKYKEDNISTESQPNLFDITSPYYDIDKGFHLNLQSLPAKFDNSRMLIYEHYSNNIETDFILLPVIAKHFCLNIIQTTSKSQAIILYIKYN